MRRTPGRIDELITVAAESRPDAIHLILTDGSFARYADTAARARGLAAALAGYGVRPGDRVACFMGNSRELYEFFVACGLLGAIGVPLNTLSTAREIERIFADCEPTGLIAESQFLDRFSPTSLAGLCCRGHRPRHRRRLAIIRRGHQCNATDIDLGRRQRGWPARDDDLQLGNHGNA